MPPHQEKCPFGNGFCRNISTGRTARVLFFIESKEMYLLHGFIKKSQKTPRRDLELAKRRKKEMEG